MTKKNIQLIQRKREDDVRDLLGKNISDDEICQKLEIRFEQLGRIKSDIIEKDRAIFDKLDSTVVYSDYLIKSKSMIKRLQYMAKRFKYRSQWTALVAAIKAEKEIYDGCIKLGQDFGFIERKQKELKLSSEFSVTDLSDDEIGDEIDIEVKRLNNLVNGNVIDIRPELAAVAGDNVDEFMPTNIVRLPEKEKRKVKVKARITLKKRQ